MDTKFIPRPVRVLHLEDNPNDRMLVAELLRDGGLECELSVADSGTEFAGALKRAEYDVIIADFSLPAYDGLTALSLARELRPETPFIFFSGTIGEELAVDSLKKGAADYVLKQRPKRLVTAVRHSLGASAERAQLRRAEEKIREQAELLDQTRDAVILCRMDPRGPRILLWNKSAERIYGWRADEVIGKRLEEVLFHDNPPPQIQEAVRSLNDRGEWMGELREFTRDGGLVIVQGRSTLIRDQEGRPKSLLIVNTDITERKLLEEKFLRAQRLESLGALVSGIAHDLNNALVPLLIGVQILREQNLPGESEGILKTMESSVRRGADMVKQVLTFARGGQADKMPVHADQLAREIAKIIGATFPKSIQCRVQTAGDAPTISGSPTQLHQVLMNLCVNARDAMPRGGALTLAVHAVRLEPDDVTRYPDTKPGEYVCFTVTDTGSGIPADHLQKIFEPFFTTKPAGKGTGLGLSTSLNIVRNHGGFVTVRSEPGRGAEFKCFLPAAGTPGELARPPFPPPTGSGQRILVVDDEEGVVAIMRAALESYGYTVLAAAGGAEALTIFAQNRDAIQLIVADLDMPFMNGLELIAAMREIRPEVKVVITSGSVAETAGAGPAAGTPAVIIKPFTNRELLETVHRVLAGKN